MHSESKVAKPEGFVSVWCFNVTSISWDDAIRQRVSASGYVACRKIFQTSTSQRGVQMSFANRLRMLHRHTL